MAQHILHMNKLLIYFLPVIVPIAVECKFQDVNCSNSVSEDILDGLCEAVLLRVGG